MSNFNDVYIMAEEPYPNLSLEYARNRFQENISEQELAFAFAVCSNKFCWFEDNEYDYKEGTPEHKTAKAIADEWCKYMEGFKAKIFAIFKSEGIEIPKRGQITVLALFMEKYGFIDGNGWWIKNNT